MQFIGKLYKYSYFVLLLLIPAALKPVNAGEENDGDGSYFRLIAATCLTCHSADSRDAAAIPQLDGLTAVQIKQLLNAYKTDREQGTIMNRISKALTDTEIDRVSAMFGKETR